jgi:hypothetical protein
MANGRYKTNTLIGDRKDLHKFLALVLKKALVLVKPKIFK